MKPKVDPRTGIALGGRKPAFPPRVVPKDSDKIETIKLSNSDLSITEEDLDVPPLAVAVTKILLDDHKDEDESNKTK